MNLIAIETKKHSKVVKSFLSQYPEAIVRLDKSITTSSPNRWCTNKNLASLHDFSLTIGDKEILSFHDHPEQLMALKDQLEFVAKLKEQKFLNFKMLSPKT